MKNVGFVLSNSDLEQKYISRMQTINVNIKETVEQH